jgi:glycerate kinase
MRKIFPNLAMDKMKPGYKNGFMKTIVIAPDKFKGSISAMEFCEAVERGIKREIQEVAILKLPLADGGDGTIDVLNYYLAGEMVPVEVHNPLLQKIKASYLYSKRKKTAYIEMSEASGIRLLKASELNPLETTTYGTGELILNALNKGAQHIILGIGGSATNDAGMGMAKALGFRFYDNNHQALTGCGKDLIQISAIDSSGVHPRLKQVKFEVACDVGNPLYGPTGAAVVYAPQKGATPGMVARLDAGLKHFNEVANSVLGRNLQHITGAGAAGGLGAGSVLFLEAKLKSGIELIKKEARFNEMIKDADWVITGEGILDQQTFSGKVIKGVMDSLTGQQLAVFCGMNELRMPLQASHNISYLKETKDFATDLDDSIKNAAIYLQMAAEEFAKTMLKD